MAEEKVLTPFQKLMDVVYQRIGFTQRDASRLAKAVKEFLKENVEPEEIEAYFDWYLSDAWRRQNRPMTIAVFLSVDSGFLSWVPGYRKKLVFNLARLQLLQGPYIHRPDLKDLLLSLEYRPVTGKWTFSELEVPWHKEAWLYLWYVIAGREHPSGMEMAHQSYGLNYVDRVLESVLDTTRDAIWRRINQLLGQFSQSVYQWQMRTATPDAPFVAEAVQIIANKSFRILRPVDTTGCVEMIRQKATRGSDLI